MQATEIQLIRKARNGDQDAFAELVKLHERFVFNLAVRTLGNPDEAADAAQEAFIRAWTALPEFREQSQFRTWLYRIVLNLCLNRVPRLRRELNDLTHEEMIDLPGNPSGAGDPVASLEQNELRAHLHRQIDRLPEQYRLLVSLRYQHELSYDEIASLLGLPVGTVKTGLFRAKARLREALSVVEEHKYEYST
ncbi:MAG TPA: sigma-70 family RNA polymerase sigma factor [Anaerolineales bacterium]